MSWWSCRELPPGPRANKLMVYKLRSFYRLTTPQPEVDHLDYRVV